MLADVEQKTKLCWMLMMLKLSAPTGP